MDIKLHCGNGPTQQIHADRHFKFHNFEFNTETVQIYFHINTNKKKLPKIAIGSTKMRMKCCAYKLGLKHRLWLTSFSEYSFAHLADVKEISLCSRKKGAAAIQ
jgi:hypothetical protein